MPKASAKQTTVHGVLGEARGRLLGELCGRPQSAVELARSVRTSDNAVRVHLEGLRSAGLVDYEVVRRGAGKPTHVYSLTAGAEYLLSSAYAPTLQALLATLRTRLNGDFVPLLRETGASLAERYAPDQREPRRRGLAKASDLLAALGAPTTIEMRGHERVLSNQCCPLAAVTREAPEVCQLMEQLLRAVSGVDLRERCERGDHPQCKFVVHSKPDVVRGA